MDQIGLVHKQQCEIQAIVVVFSELCLYGYVRRPEARIFRACIFGKSLR
jgi:hypothetical protein